MTNDSAAWERIREAFDRLVELPAEARTRELEQLAAAEPEVARELVDLLAGDDRDQGFLDQPAPLNPDLAVDIEAGTRIGPYRVTREIGRGGMGAVFEAFRDDAVFTKRVAIKVVPIGLEASMARRFEQERRILARLDHKNIAAVLDGGETPDGRPYFAMEYVHGERIDRYCDRRGLSLAARIQLLRQVCAAVQYAHQNLIIHRDLKPSNVLVAADGTVKLLDFGIATALDRTVDTATETGASPMTMLYASPEQLRGAPVSTASDIYSLGVLSFLVLAGRAPFDVDGLSPYAARQLTLDAAPPRPSELARASGMAATWPRGAAADLDQILMMAMRVEPERRYQSVEQFGEDLRRLVAGLPVTAQADSFGYRARKFVGRNRGLVAGALIALLAAGAGGLVTWRQVLSNLAEQRRTRLVSGFLRNVLSESAVRAAVGDSAARSDVSEALRAAAVRLDRGGELASDPLVEASVRQIIGANFVALGEYQAGERHLRAALAVQERALDPDDPALLRTELPLAKLALNRGDYASARAFFDRRIQAVRRGLASGELDSNLGVGALNDYGLVVRAQGDLTLAESLFREALRLEPTFDALEGPQLRGHLESMLALVLLDRGAFDEAERRARHLVTRIGAGRNDATASCTFRTLLGSTLVELGRTTEAAANLRDAAAGCRVVFTTSYLPIYDNLRLQAQAALQDGNLALADSLIDETLTGYRKHAGPRYISYASALTIKALALNGLGRGAEAEALGRQAADLRDSTMRPDHFMVALTKGALGEILTDRGQYREAESLLMASLASLEASQVAGNRRIALAQRRLDQWRQASSTAPQGSQP